MNILDSYFGEHGFLGLMFGFIRGMIKKDGLTVTGWVITIFISVNVAVIAGQAGEALELNNGLIYAVVAIASLISKDLASGLVMLGEQAARNPKEFWQNVGDTWRAYRGRKG